MTLLYFSLAYVLSLATYEHAGEMYFPLYKIVSGTLTTSDIVHRTLPTSKDYPAFCLHSATLLGLLPIFQANSPFHIRFYNLAFVMTRNVSRLVYIHALGAVHPSRYSVNITS